MCIYKASSYTYSAYSYIYSAEIFIIFKIKLDIAQMHTDFESNFTCCLTAGQADHELKKEDKFHN